MANEDAVKTTLAAAPEGTLTPTLNEEEDYEAKFQKLEAEKNKAIEEAANYKLAFLKEKNKAPVDESEEDRMSRVAQKVLAESRIADIAREQDGLLQKALKENKELKLAQRNKSTTTPPAAVGTHSEFQPVKDTLITADQQSAFKARGWSDKDIERYKRNLLKNTR